MIGRAGAELADWHPTGPRIAWLAAALALVVLPHAARVPPWLTGAFWVLVAWAVAARFTRVPAPGRAVTLLVCLGAPVGVFLTHGTLLGRDAGVGLLVILAACKLVETRTVRDAYVGGCLACFLVITNFLYSQTLPTGAYMLVVVVVIVGALVAVNGHALAAAPGRSLRLATTLVVQAAPLALVLFVLFPRLPGPLWGLPGDARAGVTKLSDTMTPGRISELSLSDAVAFRAEFDGAVPPAEDLYWRGPVLWRSDGQTWSGVETDTLEAPPFRFRERPVDYTVTLEPHFERWLFALDMPATIPPGAALTEDYQLRAPRALEGLSRYRVRSFTRYTAPAASAEALARAVQLPRGFHPRTRRLARTWRAEILAELGPGAAPSAIAEALVARALAHFRDEPFYYTLRPPLLDRDPVDEFMFLTRRGFCEFYAGAFTVLMRAAGVPTRVVTGYQGGELNEVGGYLIVRQRDAHAWTEVWLGERGWVRVDPTAAVAPQRIELGVDAALPDQAGRGALGLAAGSAVGGWLRTARHALDSLNNTWNQWVVDYDQSRQRRFLADLGIDIGDWRALGLGLLLGGLLVLGANAWWLGRRPGPSDPALGHYLAFCQRLARRGLLRAPHEGPRTFAERVARCRPELAEPVYRITDMYLALRYGTEASREGPELARLAEAIRRFRP